MLAFYCLVPQARPFGSVCETIFTFIGHVFFFKKMASKIPPKKSKFPFAIPKV